MNVSIVVPIYNEEGNVRELHQEIKNVSEEQGYDYEIIFVNDGSTDKCELPAKLTLDSCSETNALKDVDKCL